MASFERFDVVVVPFPFTDRSAEKRRPALVLSSAIEFNAPTKHAVLAMITSATGRSWALDVQISDNPVSQAYRDSRLVSIGGGADEIMLGIICKLEGTLPGKTLG